MARLSLYLIVGLIAGAIWANTGTRDPGYVLLAWGDWQIETSVWLALSLLLLGLLLLWLVLRVVRSTLSVPGAIGLWVGSRTEKGAQVRTDKGFAAFYEGRWDAAERALSKTRGVRESTLLHPLYAALAALHLGKTDRALKLLDAAEEDGTLPPSVIALVRAQSQLASGALDQAARSLASLSGQEQDTPRAKSIRCDLAQRRGEWREVCALVADVRRSHLYPSTTLDQWEQQAWCELITEGAENEALSTWKRAPEALKADNSPLWHRLIARLREDPDAEGLYKAISVRLEQYGETVTLQCVAALPEQYASKLKSAFQNGWSMTPTVTATPRWPISQSVVVTRHLQVISGRLPIRESHQYRTPCVGPRGYAQRGKMNVLTPWKLRRSRPCVKRSRYNTLPQCGVTGLVTCYRPGRSIPSVSQS